MRRLVVLLVLVAGSSALGGNAPGALKHLEHYNVTVTVIGPGYVGGCGVDGCIKCPPQCSALIKQQSILNLDPQPYTGTVFNGWGGDCAFAGKGRCSIQVNSTLNITASFGNAPPPPPLTFALTVTKQGLGHGFVGGSGIQCGATCSASLGSGARVQLVAVPDRGSVFSGWGGACSGAGPCQLTVTAVTSVAARFDLAAAPVVIALRSSVRRGGVAVLRYRVATPTGDKHHDVVTVRRGSHVLARLPQAASAGGPASVRWRVPVSTAPGAATFCVVATDTASKRTGSACARLTIR